MSAMQHFGTITVILAALGVFTLPAAAQSGNCTNGSSQSGSSSSSSSTTTATSTQLQTLIRQQIAQLQSALQQLQSAPSSIASTQLQVQIQQQIAQLQAALGQLQTSQVTTQLQRVGQNNAGRFTAGRGRR